MNVFEAGLYNIKRRSTHSMGRKDGFQFRRLDPLSLRTSESRLLVIFGCQIVAKGVKSLGEDSLLLSRKPD